MLTTVGIHPLAALGVITVDSMLFGGTVATGGVGWVSVGASRSCRGGRGRFPATPWIGT